MNPVHIPEVIEPDEKLPPDLVALRRFADLMDEAFLVPGTSRRVGLDPIVGLLPGIGDIVTGAMSTWIIIGALRHRVPVKKIFRMLFNLVADIVIGAVPLAGDLFDALHKQNTKNMRILMQYRNRRLPPRRMIEIAAAAILVMIIVAAFAVLAMLTAIASVIWITQQRLT
ncbi:MAG TPA: DUF4112 domain-containing protein [Thermoanaerobaculia bacterium]|nr:DUF4112 domain-containing protein [Thermoanaerobaculia bacterium]